tara:strand:- start:309 stop:569 length:261 start_codon:yes stop_codon:yes gene_type:complete
MSQSQTDIKRDGFVDKIESIQEQIMSLREDILEMSVDDFSDDEDAFEISIDNLESVFLMLESCVGDLEPSDYSVLTIPSKPSEVAS